MSPDDVPAEWVEKALAAAFRMPDGYAEAHPGVMRDLKVAYGDQYRAALAAVLPEAMAEALEEERDQYKAGAQELGAYLIDVTAKIALLREMVHAWDTRAADPGKSPDGLISDIREVLA